MSDHKPSGFLTRIRRMCTRFPIRDTSYLTAMTFALGSALFVVNGFFYVLMKTQPQMDFATESNIALPATSCIGDLFFILGVTFQVLEALNFGRGEIIGSLLNGSGNVETTHITEISKHAGDEEPEK